MVSALFLRMQRVKSWSGPTTLDDLREAVTTLEDAARIARRVIGGAHPLTEEIEGDLQIARAKLRARELEHCD